MPVVWALSIFSSSCVVVCAWCLESAALLLATVLGERARRVRLAVRRACACCCPVAAAVAAAARALGLSRCQACVRGAQCVRGGCVRAHAGCKEGGRSACNSCRQGVALRRERRACGPPVPVRKMLLMSPRAVAAVAAAESPVVMGACSRRRRRPAQGGGGARRGGGVGVALPIDAVVGRREDAVGLLERCDGLVEVQAKRGEVVDRGLRHSPQRSNGDDSEAVREAPLPRVVGRGWRDPGGDGRSGRGVWVSQRSYLSRFSRTT